MNNLKHAKLFVLFKVSSYTREAGVRTLERRIGAICRAVAVKVAEHSNKSSSMSMDLNKVTDKQVTAPNELKELDNSNTFDMKAPGNISSPPEMPIVIDQLAVEDILGVSNRFII